MLYQIVANRSKYAEQKQATVPEQAWSMSVVAIVHGNTTHTRHCTNINPHTTNLSTILVVD